jgi:hypothetical protein
VTESRASSINPLDNSVYSIPSPMRRLRRSDGAALAVKAVCCCCRLYACGPQGRVTRQDPIPRSKNDAGEHIR